MFERQISSVSVAVFSPGVSKPRLPIDEVEKFKDSIEKSEFKLPITLEF